MNPVESAKDLASLVELDRRFLHVFVLGPGRGESIAVALPERGWLVLDGCATVDSYPVVEVLESWGDGSLDLFLWTHPHSDHADGVPDLLERYPPRVLGLCAPSLGDAKRLLETLGTGRKGPMGPTSADLKRSAVRSAASAIQVWSEQPDRRFALVWDEVALPAGTGGVTITARAPGHEALRRYFAEIGLSGDWHKRANCYSAVVEITWGATRIVLGGDLPTYASKQDREKQRPLATGWQRVMAAHPHLGDHACVKVPHHGSADAYHHALFPADAAGRNRAWCLTPHNGSAIHVQRPEPRGTADGPGDLQSGKVAASPTP